MNDPYEKRAHVFTPQVIAEMAKKNKLAREEKYPILKNYTPPPAEVVGINVRRLKWNPVLPVMEIAHKVIIAHPPIPVTVMLELLSRY